MHTGGFIRNLSSSTYISNFGFKMQSVPARHIVQLVIAKKCAIAQNCWTSELGVVQNYKIQNTVAKTRLCSPGGTNEFSCCAFLFPASQVLWDVCNAKVPRNLSKNHWSETLNEIKSDCGYCSRQDQKKIFHFI